MVYQTIVFDLDDTLYPASSGLMSIVSQRIEAYMQQVTGLHSGALANMRRQLLDEYGTTLAGLRARYQVDSEAYLTFVHDVDPSRYLDPDPGLQRMLNRLPQRKIIFTNGPSEHAERVLTTLGVRHYFDDLLDIRSFGLTPKPHPHPYAMLTQRLGHSLAATLYVDDRRHNLEPARELGMKTIWLDAAGRLAAGHVTVRSVLELESVIVP